MMLPGAAVPVSDSGNTRSSCVLKVVVLGDGSVGKTALRNQYIHGQFTQLYKATIGADFITKDVYIHEEDRVVSLQIWDTAGQERFQSLGVAFYRGADACIVVYDVTNPKSFDRLSVWISEFVKQADIQNPDEFPFVIVANKTDVSDRLVTHRHGRMRSQELKQMCRNLAKAGRDPSVPGRAVYSRQLAGLSTHVPGALRNAPSLRSLGSPVLVAVPSALPQQQLAPVGVSIGDGSGQDSRDQRESPSNAGVSGSLSNDRDSAIDSPRRETVASPPRMPNLPMHAQTMRRLAHRGSTATVDSFVSFHTAKTEFTEMSTSVRTITPMNLSGGVSSPGVCVRRHSSTSIGTSTGLVRSNEEGIDTDDSLALPSMDGNVSQGWSIPIPGGSSFLFGGGPSVSAQAVHWFDIAGSTTGRSSSGVGIGSARQDAVGMVSMRLAATATRRGNTDSLMDESSIDGSAIDCTGATTGAGLDQLPYFETSARTGVGVEAPFSYAARAASQQQRQQQQQIEHRVPGVRLSGSHSLFSRHAWTGSGCHC